MRFGEMWSEDREVARTATLPQVPDGFHVAQVKFVDIRQKDRVKCDANPDGKVILLLLAVPNYEPFFVDVPCHFQGAVEAVCRAAGVPLPDPNEDWSCGVLKGRMVGVETIHGIGKTGREYVRVEKWKPGPAPLPAEVAKAPPRARTSSKPVATDPDDIPF